MTAKVRRLTSRTATTHRGVHWTQSLMSHFPLKSTHAPVKNYYAALAQFHQDSHVTEGNTRSAFADILKNVPRPTAGIS
jgi:hypothetical protein